MGWLKGVKVVHVTHTRKGWQWSARGSRGEVKFTFGEYARKDTAVRGARRACGAKAILKFV